MTNKTPLYDVHVALGAHMTEFGGYLMPVRYTGEKEEHQAVRQAVGIFDVSHMGEVVLCGPKALEATNWLISNDVQNIENGQAVYGALCKHDGKIVDDIICYRRSAEDVFICVNASNRRKDFAWIQQRLATRYTADEVTAEDDSDQWAQIAVQGPKAIELVSKIYGIDLSSLKKFHFITTPAFIARTGYTGEDGVEIYLPPHEALGLWNKLLDAGKALGIRPCGLSCRDTLRLEAGLCLYGNDIDESTSALEAGLGWTIKWNKAGGFVGKEALLAEKESGLKRHLVGLELLDKGIARHGYALQSEGGREIGAVTSGTISITLQHPIAMAYVTSAFANKGTTVFVDIRGKRVAARVVALPFYRRK